MRIIRRVFIGIVVSSILVLISPTFVVANPGLQVKNAIILTDVLPGNTYTHTMNVSLSENDSPMDITVDIGELEGVDKTYSARQFVTVNKTFFHLEPGQTQDIIANIQVPFDVGNGGRYAAIFIRQKSSGSGVQIAVGVDVGVYLTIKGSQLIHEGKIIDISTEPTSSGKPVKIYTTLSNLGNHHFKFKEVLDIINPQGEKLDTIYTSLSASVIPSVPNTLQATFIPKSELSVGTYKIVAIAMLDDGVIIDNAESSFEIRQSYAPPPAPAKVTLLPNTSSILKTGNGDITVNFPQGSVISQAEVSIQYYPVEQAPLPPSGYNLATTCFRIDGLTGLLTKDATITAKYSNSDLEKANGDTTKLKLARWDETDSKWTILDTTVDKGDQSLIAYTNRFSIWAIMVESTGSTSTTVSINPSSRTYWGLIGVIAAGIVLIAGGIYLFGFRRKKIRS
jgi:hypothetical protein